MHIYIKPTDVGVKSLLEQIPTYHKQASDDDDDDIYSCPRFDGKENRSVASEGEYIDMRNIVNEQQTDGGVYVGSTQQGAQMVTGVSGKGIKQEKPVPMPKPTKTRTTGTVNLYSYRSPPYIHSGKVN